MILDVVKLHKNIKLIRMICSVVDKKVLNFKISGEKTNQKLSKWLMSTRQPTVLRVHGADRNYMTLNERTHTKLKDLTQVNKKQE